MPTPICHISYDTKINNFRIKVPFHSNHIVKNIPDRRWSKAFKCWNVPCLRANANYIKNNMMEISTFTDEALEHLNLAIVPPPASTGEMFPRWFPFKGKPMKHQLEVLDKSWSMDCYGYFMEQGLGKTYVTIAIASALAMEGKITTLVIVCPTSVKPVWEIEIEKWCPIPYVVHTHSAGTASGKRTNKFIQNKGDKLEFYITGIESFSQGHSIKYAEKVILTRNAGLVVDESTGIKTPSAVRTEKVVDLGLNAKKRWILTGTPITQGIQDLYSQFKFLDENIIGYDNYTSFKNYYCIMGGFDNKQIEGYQNIPELLDIVKDYCSVVKKKDALDLPPKVYEPRYIDPSKEQIRLLFDMKKTMHIESEGDSLTVKNSLDKMTRLQQISGGNMPFTVEENKYSTKPIVGENPKLKEMMRVIDEIDGKIIIWARFVPELKLIHDALAKEYGENSILIHYGGISREDRKKALMIFETDPTKRFFVVNQATGSRGLTLNAASYVIYYSNSFSYEDRAQSEDRNHRVGQENKVTYFDLILNHPTDKAIIEALRNKKDVADYVSDTIRNGSEPPF